MAKLVYTGEEYINADHIIYIEAPAGSDTMEILLDTGVKFRRNARYLTDILNFVNYDM